MNNALGKLIVRAADLEPQDADLPLALLLNLHHAALRAPLENLARAYAQAPEATAQRLASALPDIRGYIIASVFGRYRVDIAHQRLRQEQNTLINAPSLPDLATKISAEQHVSREAVNSIVLFQHLWVAGYRRDYAREILPIVAPYYTHEFVEMVSAHYC